MALNIQDQCQGKHDRAAEECPDLDLRPYPIFYLIRTLVAVELPGDFRPA